MALTRANLVRTSNAPYAAGKPKSKYSYTTDDTTTQVLASGYFNSATDVLNKGDIIICHCAQGGTPTMTMCTVTSASQAATVTVAAAVFT